MNISQMIRSFLGEPSIGDSRAMELRAGQIVRGVILHVMENNEALVQINGVQVRAKLELPLQSGQTAMLQVQPQSNGALIMLKQVDPGTVGLPEDTFKEWARQLALPEQKWAVELVKDLRRDCAILNREVAKPFQQAASILPAGGNSEQWMRASAAAFKRGLPMTENIIGALRQVMFGSGPHELLDALQRQLNSKQEDAGGEAGQKLQSKAASRVMTLLSEGALLLRAAAAGGEGSAANGINGMQRGTAAVPHAANGSQAESLTQTAANASVGDESAEQANAASSVRASAAGSSNWIGQMMKWLGVDHELQLTRTIGAAQPESNRPAARQNARQDARARAGMEADASMTRTKAAQPEEAPVHKASPIEGQTASMQGEPIDQDERQSRLLEARQQIERAASASALQAFAANDGSPASEPLQPTQQPESLKSALLSLIAADDVPAAAKETAQQLVQQITGQQLLLTPERNSSLLTHVTMFIPIHGQEGNQTASVHIQTRRGRKGELDASNCRLLFNLSMHTLGETMVDVNVTDKIVSLNLWNDHPAVASLAEISRAEIAGSLQQAGYQLLSLRTTPLPKAIEQSDKAEADAVSKTPQPPDLSQFESTRYKGVDYRI